MNRDQLAEKVAARTGGTKKDARAAIEAFTDTIADAVAAGEKVALLGFGVFESVTRPERQGRNPATGQTITVPATRVPKFKPGQGFRDAVKTFRRSM